ncbi:MAG TPA: dihydrodipicolinate synthase family protein [Acidimicrobiales bacterium]|nr:dihydrodipicolinate synthase family protein [Acidimicrobiales bacterium]
MTATPFLASGVGVALVTIFAADGEVDLKATAGRASRCVELGVSSILVAGTTGEADRLTVGDRVELAAAVKDSVPGVPVVVGTGQTSVDDALEVSARLAAHGDADGLLVYCPEATEPDPFFGAIREAAGGRPVLAYHNPGLAARELTTDELPTLDVDGVKDSSGSSNRLADLIELGMRVYVGSPTQLVLAGACGAAGALLALANIAPTDCIAAWNGDAAAQRRLFTMHRESAHEFPACLKRREPA